jgi:hypothetical protein
MRKKHLPCAPVNQLTLYRVKPRVLFEKKNKNKTKEFAFFDSLEEKKGKDKISSCIFRLLYLFINI